MFRLPAAVPDRVAPALRGVTSAHGPVRRALRGVRKLWARLAGRPGQAVLLSFAIPLILRAALLPVLPIPNPLIHDEFSYLLAADTFASGRLTNPTPPFWRHFKSEHIILRPSYTSKYPPAQGLVLAAGQRLFGHPWWGVYLSMGAFSALTCWMLLPWFPVRWAFLGGLLVTMRFGVAYYWMNSYWGGAVAAASGCLLIGAAVRIRKRRRPLDAALFGLAIVILVNSRPFEGALLSLPISLYLANVLAKLRPWREAARLAVSLALVLAAGASLTLFYCWRVTGDPLLHPYFVYWRSYPQPHFTFQPQNMKGHRWLPPEQAGEEASQPGEPVLLSPDWPRIYLSYVGMFLSMAFGRKYVLLILLFLVPLWKNKLTRYSLLLILMYVIVIAAEAYFRPHYAAPMMGVVMILIIAVLRRLFCLSWRSLKIGPLLAGAAVAISAWATIHNVVWPVLDPPFASQRAGLVRQLEAAPGNDLVMVRYGKDHNRRREWVYNRSDIPNAKVIWARELGLEADREMMDYFKDRKLWLLEADLNPPVLHPLRRPNQP